MANEYKQALATLEDLAERAIDEYSDWFDYNYLGEFATEALKIANKAEETEDVDLEDLEYYIDKLTEILEAIDEQIEEYPSTFEAQYSGSRFFTL